jgi:hypothetical protein
LSDGTRVCSSETTDYAFPESVDLKGIDLSILKQNPKLIDNLYQNVIVENRQGDFEIKSIQTDVPFLKITQAPLLEGAQDSSWIFTC